MTLPAIAFPSDLLGLAGPEQTEIGLDIVFRLPGSEPDHRLAVRFSRRIQAQTKIELWGTALEGTFAVQITGRADNQWRMQTRVADVAINGNQMLAILDTFDAIGRSTGVGLALTDQTPTTWSPLATAGLSTPPPGLRPVVEAHAEIERHLGVSIAAPVSYSPDEVRDTIETAALLRGETVSQQWQERRWELPSDEADQLVEGVFAEGESALMEVEERWTWVIDGHEISIGTVAVAYHAARIAKVLAGEGASASAKPGKPRKSTTSDSASQPSEEAERRTTLVLTPGPNDQVHFKLLRTAAGHDRTAGAEQQWFWDPEWQAREAEVDRFVEAGDIETHDDSAAFLAHLDTIAHDV